MGEKEKEEKDTNKTRKFESLSPKPIDPDSISIYLEALKEGLDDIDVKNLAITGPYGSGKSSILRSFFKRHDKDFNFLNISLAEFEWDANSDKPNGPNSFEGTKGSPNNIDKLVEFSILQQIFYKVKPDELPDSRLERIKNISPKRVSLVSVAFVAWLVSIYSLFEFNYFSNLNPTSWRFSWIAVILFIVTLIGLFFIIKKCAKWLYSSRINRVNVKGVELGKEISESILNRHLDEILYFFERTEYDVVVIEDLDRQEELNIFTKLREINYLINNSKQVISGNREKITFIYAVRDDILKEKDRTKFFDLVIPVIPFINSYNSNEKLRERLLTNENKLLAHPVTEEFIDDISLYIDDMRLLLNICNEYEIYKENLNKGLKQDNLLAMVVYKNMRPKDFVKLHNRQGMVFSLLSRERKSQIITSLIKDIDVRQEKLKNEIKRIENDKLEGIQEINAVYLYHLLLKVNANRKPDGFFVDDELIPVAKLESEPHFQKLDKNSTIKFRYQGAYNGDTGITFNDLEKLVPSKLTYEEHIANINDGKAQVIARIKYQVNNLESDKTKAKNWGLETLFKKFKLMDFLEKEEQEDRLMLFLLRNGFIDENYQDYISYFHGVSLSKEDNEFLISVTSESPLEYDFEIKNTKNVLKRIQPRYFEKRAILNFDLVSFVLRNRKQYPVQLESILSMLIDHKGDMDEAREKFSFVKKYLEKFPLGEKDSTRRNHGKTDVLLNEITKKWDDFWGFIDSSSGLSDDEKKITLNYILSVVNDKNIEHLNKTGLLKKYIESLPDFLSVILKGYEQKLGTVFQKLEVKFLKLDPPIERTKPLFDFVYEHNHYKLNDENIVLMMNEFGLKEGDIPQSRYSFTSIFNSPCDDLKDYIHDQINEYIEYTNEVQDAYLEEREEAIIEVSNNEKLKTKNWLTFLYGQTVKVLDLSKIQNTGKHGAFFEYSKVDPNWSNVTLYFSESKNSIDGHLLSYLNEEENYNELSSQKIKAYENNTEEYLVENISLALILCEELSIESYVELLKSVPDNWKDLETTLGFEKLSKNKVLYLIQNGFITFSETDFKKINENYSDLLIEYLLVHQETFVSEYDADSYNWSASSMFEFFDSPRIKTENKIKAFEKRSRYDIISDSKLSDKLCDILASYGYTDLDFEYLSSFFNNAESVESRIKLFNLNHRGLVTSEIVSLIGQLPEPYRRISLKHKRPEIDKTHANIEFVKVLEENKFISSYQILDDTIKVVARY